jgi:anti-sigma factor RsiW
VTVHLTDAQLKAFVTGTASPDDVLAADDHLAVCAACRKLVSALDANGAERAERDAIGALRQALLPVDVHLADEEVQAYVAGTLDADARARVDAHIGDCGTCAHQIEELRAWAAGATPTVRDTRNPRRSALRWYALAAAILFAIVLPVGYYWQASRPRPDLPALPGFAGLPAEAQERVRTAVSSGTVALPREIAELAGRRDTLMGRVKAPGFGVVAPVATAVTDDRPVFTWRPLEGADSYDLAVLDDRGQPAAATSVVEGTTARLTEALPRGRVYTWQVTARAGARLVTAPAAPEPVARFKVIDEATASVLRRLEREHPDSHVLLVILYLQAGAVDDAVRHMRAVDANDPYAPLARRALEQLERVPYPGATP